MPYTLAQKGKIKAKVLNKISMEFNYAEDDETLNALLEKYGVHFEEEPAYVNTRQMKILVFGALAGNIKDYRIAAKRLGISESSIV